MSILDNLKAVAKAYKQFKNHFEYGKTTDELFENFKRSLDESLGEYEIVYDYIWGKDSLNIDGQTTGYYPKVGDTLIMDISVGKNGVWCDVCRTFFVGEISQEQEETFEFIKNALRVGQSAIKKGSRACDVFNIVNQEFLKIDKKLIHHAGHQVGEKPLMQPQFLAENTALLEIGKFYTIEPGLYNRFGIRIENNFELKEDGAVDLFEQLLPLNIKEYLLK